jgi:hypothetical protein
MTVPSPRLYPQTTDSLGRSSIGRPHIDCPGTIVRELTKYVYHQQDLTRLPMRDAVHPKTPATAKSMQPVSSMS